MKILPPREGTTFRDRALQHAGHRQDQRRIRCGRRDSLAEDDQGARGVQIDRFGNLNATVIGDYQHPKVRLPNSGGACEIAILAKRVLVIAPQSKRSFPERVDFITSPGFVDGPEGRHKLGLPGGGPEMVITNLGCYEFSDGEMVLTSLHPGCAVEQVRENTGWDIRISPQLTTTEIPSDEELRILRENLDPSHLFI